MADQIIITHNQKNMFLRRLENKQKITKDFVLFLFKEQGISPGSLFQAKINYSALETANVGNPTVDILITNNGEHKKYIKRNKYSKCAPIHKGDIGMFLDVGCEAITSGSIFVSVKFLVNKKIIDIAYDLLDDDFKSKSYFLPPDINILTDWLKSWNFIIK